MPILIVGFRLTRIRRSSEKSKRDIIPKPLNSLSLGRGFAACGNTMTSQKVTPGDLLPGFVSADKGSLVRIAVLQSQGYLYLRP